MASSPPNKAAAATMAQARPGAAEWIMPIAAVGLIFVMLVPLPSLLLDMLLATSITAAVLVLAVRHPDSAPVAVFGFSQLAAAAHPVPALAESGLQPPHSAARQRRRRSRRAT